MDHLDNSKATRVGELAEYLIHVECKQFPPGKMGNFGKDFLKLLVSTVFPLLLFRIFCYSVSTIEIFWIFVVQNICVDICVEYLFEYLCWIFVEYLCWIFVEYLCRFFFAGRCLLLLKYSPAWRRVPRGCPAGWACWIYAGPHPCPIFTKLSKYSHHRNMEILTIFPQRYGTIKIC